MRYENSRLGLKYIANVWEGFRESISIPSNNNSSPNIEKDLWMFYKLSVQNELKIVWENFSHWYIWYIFNRSSFYAHNKTIRSSLTEFEMYFVEPRLLLFYTCTMQYEDKFHRGAAYFCRTSETLGAN